MTQMHLHLICNHTKLLSRIHLCKKCNSIIEYYDKMSLNMPVIYGNQLKIILKSILFFSMVPDMRLEILWELSSVVVLKQSPEL